MSPWQVSADLLALTRWLGEPERDLVILSEGNTSEQVGDAIVVKASGSSMRTATPDDFVTVDVDPLVALLRDPAATQDDLTRALTAGEAEGRPVRASVESLVHAAVRAVAPMRFVAHTHPTDAVALLASRQAATAFAEPVYTDELLILGRPLFVPYAQPGIELGRLFLASLEIHVAEHGEPPSLVLLGNHGIVALSQTTEGAEAVSLMAVKSARVRLGARAAGGVAPLGADATAHYFERPDFAERRAHLAGTE
ncbi:class II aldolase/adducin family protein [Microbacterium sp. gxy059]|uniref:class II aldolase/adducin family protein n=1 Tax=Microbacterium sp. gxy059 TaxID=2957199 RepID=UPI003D995E6A